MNTFVILFALLAISSSAYAVGVLGGIGGGLDYYAYPRYQFGYAVSDHLTGDNKQQTEVRDGPVVKGQYSLVEPDGSVRVVTYGADDINGFNAIVKRVGGNLHAGVGGQGILG